MICVSPDLHDECLRSGVRSERCLVIENGIDTTEYVRDQSTTQAKEELGIPSDQLVVGAVGRLSAEKGFDGLIRAADKLFQEGLNFQVLIIGEGDEQPSLQELIVQLHRADRIHMLGYRPGMKNIYEAMDVFVLSSLREGLPNVVLEAMAMEVPVVATPVAGVPNLIDDGVNGVLSEDSTPEQLAKALRPVLRDESLRSQIRRAARQTIEARCSFARRMERIRRTYDEILQTAN